MQTRKFLLTINNPLNYGFSHAKICEIIEQSNPVFYCMVDEIGEQGTFHTHVFAYMHSPIRFSTLKKRFPEAHIDSANGSVSENVAYLKKEGKWAKTKKTDTTVEGTYEEFGIMPDENQEKHPDLADVINEIDSGATTAQIVRNHPKFALRAKNIDDLRETIRAEKFSEIIRDINVNYVFSRYSVNLLDLIFKIHNPKDVCIISNYGKNGGTTKFDSYKGQEVIVFNNFHGQIPLEEFLLYLDIYPCELPARYYNRMASYTDVYVLAYIPLEQQFSSLRGSEELLLDKFFNKIDKILEITADGSIIERR